MTPFDCLFYIAKYLWFIHIIACISIYYCQVKYHFWHFYCQIMYHENIDIIIKKYFTFHTTTIFVYNLPVVKDLGTMSVHCSKCENTFWLVCLTLLRTFIYKFSWGHMYSFLLDIYLGVQLLSHMITFYLTIWGGVKLFSTAGTPFNVPTSSVQGLQFL